MLRKPLTRCSLVASSILAVGWSAALGVYVSTRPALENDEALDVQHSKAYLRDLERIGGWAAAFTRELNEWVAGLWHGRSLAYTIGCLTAVVACAYVLLHRPAAECIGDEHEPAGGPKQS